MSNPFLKAALNWVLARAAEPSTWGGLILAVPALSAHASLVAHLASLGASLLLVLTNEQRKLTPAVVVQDVEPVVASAVAEILPIANATA